MAAKRKKALGKGLDLLFDDDGGTAEEEAVVSETPDSSAEHGENVTLVKIIDIEPNKNQPRKTFDQEKLKLLSSSISRHGLMQPILVKPTEYGTYSIVAGERRWRAAKLAGLKEIPCVIKEIDSGSVMELALIENLQREDLNPIEEAEGYKALMETCAITQEDVAERVGKSRSAIANSLRLNNLTDGVKALVAEGKLSAGHARTLLGIADSDMQLKAAELIIKNGLSVRQTEKLVANPESKPPKQPKQVSGMMKKYYSEIENDLGSRLGTKVKISEGANKGKIEIEYYSKDDLERILFELKR